MRIRVAVWPCVWLVGVVVFVSVFVGGLAMVGVGVVVRGGCGGCMDCRRVVPARAVVVVVVVAVNFVLAPSRGTCAAPAASGGMAEVDLVSGYVRSPPRVAEVVGEGSRKSEGFYVVQEGVGGLEYISRPARAVGEGLDDLRDAQVLRDSVSGNVGTVIGQAYAHQGWARSGGISG